MSDFFSEFGKVIIATITGLFIISIVAINANPGGIKKNIFTASNEAVSKSYDNTKSLSSNSKNSASSKSITEAYNRRAPEISICTSVSANKDYALNGSIIKSSGTISIKNVKAIHLYYLGRSDKAKTEITNAIKDGKINFPKKGNYEIKVTAEGTNGVLVSETGFIGVGASENDIGNTEENL